MTTDAVSQLLTAMDKADTVGWTTGNIAAGLLLAATEVRSWEAEEWAVEPGPDDEALAWAEPGESRTPFNWLRARGVTDNMLFDTYQDDGAFGLRFRTESFPERSMESTGLLRPRGDLTPVTGRIRAVEIVYDTTVDYVATPGLVTECLLHGEEASLHLIAAEADSRDEWHLYDESVVVLTDPRAADKLAWYPSRQSWSSKHLGPLSSG